MIFCVAAASSIVSGSASDMDGMNVSTIMSVSLSRNTSLMNRSAEMAGVGLRTGLLPGGTFLSQAPVGLAKCPWTSKMNSDPSMTVRAISLSSAASRGMS